MPNTKTIDEVIAAVNNAAPKEQFKDRKDARKARRKFRTAAETIFSGWAPATVAILSENWLITVQGTTDVATLDITEKNQILAVAGDFTRKAAADEGPSLPEVGAARAPLHRKDGEVVPPQQGLPGPVNYAAKRRQQRSARATTAAKFDGFHEQFLDAVRSAWPRYFPDVPADEAEVAPGYDSWACFDMRIVFTEEQNAAYAAETVIQKVMKTYGLKGQCHFTVLKGELIGFGPVETGQPPRNGAPSLGPKTAAKPARQDDPDDDPLAEWDLDESSDEDDAQSTRAGAIGDLEDDEQEFDDWDEEEVDQE